VAFLIQSAQILIEKAGSLKTLQRIVQDTTMFRQRFDELGGLQGLDQLVSQANTLQVKQRELAELRSDIDGPTGLKARASKYDQLQQAFAAIERSPADALAKASAPTAKIMAKQMNTPPSSTSSATPSSDTSVKMNPERARLLSAKPHPRDPDRDLYEPRLQPPPRNLSTKADNANNIPLSRLPPLPSRFPADRDLSGTWRKRKHDGDSQAPFTKRPRVDLGRASALLQATLAPGSVGSTQS
jgi:hypothetical protein